MTAQALDLPTAPTYLLYEGPDDVCVEMGQVFCVPRPGENVAIDGKHYRVDYVYWEVITGEHGTTSGVIPQQCATVILKEYQPDTEARSIWLKSLRSRT